MGCEARWAEIGEVNRALGVLRRAGLGPGTDVYGVLYKELGALKARMGLRAPSFSLRTLRVKGMSPGEFDVIFDSVRGWLVRGRADAWSPWVEHYVDETIAEAVMARRLTPGQERFLLTPSIYVGE